MPSIRDLFSFYLKAEHLQGRSVVVHIESCTIEQVFNPRAKRNEPRLLLRFHGKKLALTCNKTQASQLERITGTDDYSRWPGHSITLTPGKASTGADTIIISAAPTSKPVHEEQVNLAVAEIDPRRVADDGDESVATQTAQGGETIEHPSSAP